MFFNDRREKTPRVLPLLPLRDIVVFPHMVVPLFVGRPKSIGALDEAMANGDKEVLLAAQRKAKTDAPTPDDIFRVGTVGHILQLLRLPDGTVKVLIEGRRRARVRKFVASDAFYQCQVEDVIERVEITPEVQALVRSVQGTFESYVKLNKRIQPEMLMTIAALEEPARLADTVAAHLALKLADKQEILETEDPKRRLERLYELIQSEIEILLVEKKIRSRVKKTEPPQEPSAEGAQPQQRGAGPGGEGQDKDEFKNELQELEAKINKKEMSEESKQKLRRELKKLKMMSPMSAEATVVRNYVDTVIALPWKEMTEDKLDIAEAESVLDFDHYGLEKAKERILEYLAVQALVKHLRGPILCLVGPPGVGKTSLARSIARATGRNFVRLSLGGVRDEAEIRGHRRTYIGAMPGKIMQSLRKAGSNNPVMLLDEVDKMSMDFRGDPAAALLEVLDPEQNHSFVDHYIDLDYDLSQVMFITTANNLTGVPLPLQDRMEIIQLSGYTEFDKLQIARRHLLPKQMRENGLAEAPNVAVEFTDGALRTLVSHYTREAGVRNLEREIGGVCRKIAREVLKEKPPAESSKRAVQVTSERIPKYLGPHKFRHHLAAHEGKVGVVNGLAVTFTGGDLLQVEVTKMPGRGKLTVTGKLGDVMKESAQAAMSYVRSRANELGLSPDFYQDVDLHIHFPEGAIPKDGPSAGITTATALVSALTGIPARGDVAMTGEITLRGRVLPIGGLKEKVMAAHRAGVRLVVCPADNRRDLHDIPKPVLAKVRLEFVEHMDEVLTRALQENAFVALLEKTRAQALLPADASIETPPATEPRLPDSVERLDPADDDSGDAPTTH